MSLDSEFMITELPSTAWPTSKVYPYTQVVYEFIMLNILLMIRASLAISLEAIRLSSSDRL